MIVITIFFFLIMNVRLLFRKSFVLLSLLVVLKKTNCLSGTELLWRTVYLELVYLVTALVPSETACLASSPGSRSLTAVWISLEVMVDLLL